MTSPTLPKGWSVEMLGLANAVSFTGPNGTGLLWTDDRWYLTHGASLVPARSVPFARTQTEARRIGSEFINKMEED